MSVLAVIGKILLILLKVLGWTLLGVLGLILIVLLLVLFLPIGYEAKASAIDKNVKAEVKAHLLLNSIKAVFTFKDKKLNGILKIFWIKKNLIGGEKKPEESPPEVSAEGSSEAFGEEDLGLDLSDSGPEEEESPPEQETKPEENPPEQEAVPEETPESKPEESPPEEEPEPEPEPEPDPDVYTFLIGTNAKEFHWEGRLPFTDKIDAVVKTVYAKVTGITEKMKKAVSKIQELTYKAETLIHKVVDYPDRPYLQSLLLRILKKLIRRIRPRRFEVNMVYGMESPVTTGKIAAAYGVLSVVLGDIKHYQIRTKPDFEQKILDGDLYLKGRIQGYMFVFPVLRLAVDRKVWRLIKLLRNKKSAPKESAS